jgi:hypothetical protein
MEEYSVIHQYLSDQLDVIETNLEDMQTQKEDAEMEEHEGNIHDEVKQDPREVDPTTDDIEQAKEEDAERCPVTGKLRKSDEEHKDMSVLSPEDYANAVEAGKIDPADYGYNTLQKFYFKKREGGEDEEKAKKDYDGDGKLESSTAEYMGSRDKAIKAAMSKEEENEEIALSPQEVARQMLIQRQNEMQNYYTQERLNRYGY